MGDCFISGKDDETVDPLSKARSFGRPMTGASFAHRVSTTGSRRILATMKEDNEDKVCCIR